MRLAGLLYSSLTDCGGQTADGDISPDKVLNYLRMRHSGQFQAEPDLVARPSITTTVLLKAAELFGLEEVFDDDLWRLDWVTLGAYFTNDFEQFGDEHMQGGENNVWQIGHDVFRVKDLDATWPEPAPQRSPAAVLKAGAAMASLLYPDRVAWILLPRRARI
jgi:hypothetical protein